MAGAEATLWQIRSAQAVRSEPTDLSAVLDFDVRADTVFGAVMNVAQRAGYRVKANDDIWLCGGRVPIARRRRPATRW